MKKYSYLIIIVLISGLVLAGCSLLSNVGQVPTSEQSGINYLTKNETDSITKDYGDVTLSGGFQTGHFPEIWDLTDCDMVISFTYDATGLVDDNGAHAWAQFGIRQVCKGDFNPTAGSGVWFATDYEWADNTFDSDPPGSPTLDIDDKMLFQKTPGHGEGDYDLPSTPPIPGKNHRIWFDRDGVDQYQAQNPLAVDGGTYNTGGTYDIVITLHADGNTTGTAYMTINGLDQGFETDGNWNTMELTPAGMTFTGDMTKMQIFYGIWGYSGVTHTVAFKDITVDGCLAEPIVIETITINPEIAEQGTEIELTAVFTGPTWGNYTATIDWDDGSDTQGTGTVNVSNGAGTVNGSHTYASTGVYTVEVTLNHTICSYSNSVTAEFQYAVVYDSSEGFVTGGGWIDSPAGAYTSDPTLTGPANFGFVSKYKKGQSIPTGNTEFKFKAGNLNFHSDRYDWLVIAGPKAIYKGTGTINGTGDYGFMLSAIDEELMQSTDVDMFRIKIWDKSIDTAIYDNQISDDDNADPTTEIGGGQIVIHKGK